MYTLLERVTFLHKIHPLATREHSSNEVALILPLLTSKLAVVQVQQEEGITIDDLALPTILTKNNAGEEGNVVARQSESWAMVTAMATEGEVRVDLWMVHNRVEDTVEGKGVTARVVTVEAEEEEEGEHREEEQIGSSRESAQRVEVLCCRAIELTPSSPPLAAAAKSATPPR